ncbi:MAG TPA: hypothetical protein VNA17_08885, partial [Pyrinomonadaceae bacterium]|nr:hypothetical protein [Pyrinomonadaceae bacterium]
VDIVLAVILRGAERFRWLAAAALLAALAITALALINIVSRHALDGPLINAYGKKADAKVLSKQSTNSTFNEQPVERYNIIFRTEAGQNVETYFETWDFNIYPPANSVRYPTPGQNFRVAYLPVYPTAFLILTDEKSEYQTAQRCAAILADVEQKRNKYQFDKNNPAYLSQYMTALSEGIRQECAPGLLEELRSIGGGKTK